MWHGGNNIHSHWCIGIVILIIIYRIRTMIIDIQEDIEDFSNAELRRIKMCLWSNDIDELPYKIGVFVIADPDMRKRSVLAVINAEILLRFDIGDLK